MAKKSVKSNQAVMAQKYKQTEESAADLIFKSILRVMSWIVGISFILIIVLPEFRISYIDESVKFIFFLGIFTLILFGLLEAFAGPIKRLIEKRMT